MHHETPLITTIVAGLVLAFIFGMVANRFKLPPLVGYLFAGILVGPHTPGYVADQELGVELAELGVILLMFGVGLHFSLKDLMSVRALAIPGAIAQIAFATLLGAGLGLLMGWDLPAGLLFGLALSVASTVVLLKALQDRRLIETERGRIAVGWLIVEDLAMVLALVLIPALAGLGGNENLVHDPFVSFVERVLRTDIGIWGVLGLTLIKVAAFVGFMLIVGRRIIPWALHVTAHTGSRELFRLAVLAIALGVALGSAVLFGVSLALGAFFAGMILSESELSHRAAQETLPLRDAFSVLFFVSVGMLFDPSILVTNPLPVLATVFIIIVGKSLAAFGIVLLFRRPVATALTISASLAQIGEFSFILASLGVGLAVLPSDGQDLILAGALISIVLNPLVFWGVDMLRPNLEARLTQRRAGRGEVRIEPGETLEAGNGVITSDAPNNAGLDTGELGADDDLPEPTQQSAHTILVGFGRVGSVVGAGLHGARAPLVVIEDSDHSIAEARTRGIEVVVGNAASREVLELANITGAKCLMIAIPNGFEAGSVCEMGRKLNADIRIIARAHSEEEESHLRALGANTVIMGEREIGLGMLAWLRGDRSDDGTGTMDPVEPRLDPVPNILETVAASSAVEGSGEAVAEVQPEQGSVTEAEDVTSAEILPADGEPVANLPEPVEAQEPSLRGDILPPEEPESLQPVEAVSAETVITLPPPEKAADEPQDAVEPGEEIGQEVPVVNTEPQDPVVLAAVEAASPDAAEAPLPGGGEVGAASLETVEATPAVGEMPQPAAEDETIPEESPEQNLSEEPSSDAASERGQTVEASGSDDENTDGNEDRGKEGGEVEAQDKPAGSVPPVLPEPKG